MINRKRYAAILFFFFLGALYSYADKLSADLIILGPGKELYRYWGHIGIRIKNHDTSEDLFYDFGNFSFYSENFYRDFLMGDMRYLGFVVSTASFLERSQKKDQDLFMYTLNLGQSELEELNSKLKWWVEPENREYLYNYFINNCSTIIRDILNQVTDGQLKEFSSGITDRTFRHYTRTGAHPSLPIEIMLHYLLGPSLDKTITGWDLMFLPQSLADITQKFTYLGRDGEIRTLATNMRLLKKSSRLEVPDTPRKLWLWLLFLGVFCAILWWISNNRWYGIMTKICIVLLVGFPGLVLGLFRLFTHHWSTNGNINIWPAFPSIFLAIIPILAHQWKHAESVVAGLWTINILGLVATIILLLTGVVFQDVTAFLAFYTPILLVASYPGYIIKQRLRR